MAKYVKDVEKGWKSNKVINALRNCEKLKNRQCGLALGPSGEGLLWRVDDQSSGTIPSSTHQKQKGALEKAINALIAARGQLGCANCQPGA